ncbi:hypothetical protein AAG906_022671 [Vitis piasezkii]
MSGQGIRTHHWRTAEHGLWICYHPGCDDRKCRVLHPEGVRIAMQRVSSWGIRMEFCRICCVPCHREGSLHLVHADGPLRCADISLRNSSDRHVRILYRYFTSGVMRMGDEGVQIPGQTYPDPLIPLTESIRADNSDYRILQVAVFLSSQSNSEDFSSRDENYSSSLGVKDHLEWQMLGPQSRDTSWTQIKWHHYQGPLRGHESAETPIGNESNGAVVGDGATSHCAYHVEYEITEEAMNFMSYVAEVSRRWDEPNAQNMGRMTSQPNAKGEMNILNDDIDMKAKIAAMARRLEELEMKKMQEVQAISQTPLQAMPCAICLSYEHLPPQYKQPAQVPQQASNLEQAMVNLSKVVGDFVGAHKSINAQLSQRIDSVESSLNKKMDGVQNDLSQKMDNLQYSISRFANLNKVQEKGNFPSQPHQNSKGIHEVETKKGESSMVKEVKTVITLRSGKEVDLPTCKLEHDEESEAEKEKREEIKGKRNGKSIEKDGYDLKLDEEPQRIVIKKEMMKHMPPPFPQTLYGKIIQSKPQVRDANFIWDPSKLNQDQIFFDGLSLSKD